MSATHIPGATPASFSTCSASPSRSRASSVEKASLTIGATSRSALGKRGSSGAWRQAPSAVSRRKAQKRLFDILDLDALAGDALRQSRGHEPVQVAVEHIARRSRCHAGPQILHELVRLQHIAADLVAPADVGFRGVCGIRLSLALLKLSFVQPSLELLHRGCAVLVLRSLVLAGDDNPRRNVRDPDRAVGRIDVLSARAGCAIGVDTKVLVLDLDVDVLIDLGIDPDARKARVTASVGIIRADADQPVDATLHL